MSNKVIFTEKEIFAYIKAYEDLEKRHKEGDLKGKWDPYWKAKESIDNTIKNVSLMRERKYYTDLLDAFSIAVGRLIKVVCPNP
jgi:mRNA-degrading endonuclease YafQ of YafQ-DinJ toxin-antitoxin module